MTTGAAAPDLSVPPAPFSRVPCVRNAKAVWAFLFAVVALGALVVAAAQTNRATSLELSGYVGVGAAFVCALLSLSLARRARFDYQQTIGRVGGRGLAAFTRALALTALILSLTGALAIAVFVVLDLVA